MFPNVLEVLKTTFHCPPHLQLSNLITKVLCLIFLYLCLYSFDPKSALPGNCTNTGNISMQPNCDGGNFFGLFVLFICAIIGGSIILLIKLPPLLGMLVMGFILRNFPYLNTVIFIDKFWGANLRKMALLVILTRAGLALDFQALKRLSFVVLRLGFIPCLVEAFAATIVAHFLLGLPWGWSFILGFVLGAVSPAVVVPSMIGLEMKGLGIDQGVNTLVIAAASIDDVLAITGFGVALAFTFSSSDSMLLHIFQGPFEAIIGIIYGILMGFLLWFLPSSDNDKFMFYRTTALFLFASGAMFGCSTFSIPGSGPLAVLTLAFVASIRWRKETTWKNKENPLLLTTEIFWWLLQPFLFGLIGAGLDVRHISAHSLTFGILTLSIALLCRLIVSFLVLFRGSFDLKEKLFISIAWLPKATVQAAIGPLALDYALKKQSPNEFIRNGQLILAISVLSIIITAPLGATLISLTGPILLKKSSRIEKTIEVKEETEETQALFNLKTTFSEA